MPLTVVYITQSELHRFDFKSNRSRVVQQHWQTPRPDIDRSETLVDLALRQGKKRRGDVIVLRADWWTGVCAIDQETLRQVGSDGLQQTLAMEAETQSGIDAFGSQIGYAIIEKLATQDEYFVLQIPQHEVDSVDEVVRDWGSKLKGLSHPAMSHLPAIPKMGHGDLVAGQTLIQTWPNLTIISKTFGGTSTSEVSGSHPRFEIIAGDINSPSVSTHVKSLLQPSVDTAQPPSFEGQIEVQEIEANAEVDSLFVVPQEREAQLAADQTGLSLRGTGIPAQEWIERWLDYRAGLSVELPIIVPKSRPLSSQAKFSIAAMAGLVAIALCAGHWLISSQILAGRNEVISKLEADLKEQTDLNQSISNLDKEIQESKQVLEQTMLDREQVQSIISVQRIRHVDLLSAIQTLASPSLLVDEIRNEANRAFLIGFALDSHAYNEFTTGLERELMQSGWRVNTPKASLQENGLYRFEIQLDFDVSRHPAFKNSLESQTNHNSNSSSQSNVTHVDSGKRNRFRIATDSDKTIPSEEVRS